MGRCCGWWIESVHSTPLSDGTACRRSSGTGCRYGSVTLKTLVRLRRVAGLVDSRSVPGRAGSNLFEPVVRLGLRVLLLSGQQHHGAAGSPAEACRAEDWKGNWSGLALFGPNSDWRYLRSESLAWFQGLDLNQRTPRYERGEITRLLHPEMNPPDEEEAWRHPAHLYGRLSSGESLA